MNYDFILTGNPVNQLAASVLQKGTHYLSPIERNPKESLYLSKCPLPTIKIPKYMKFDKNFKNFKDLTGIRFGTLKVIGLIESTKIRWLLRCDCGYYIVMKSRTIITEKNKKCPVCRDLESLKNKNSGGLK